MIYEVVKACISMEDGSDVDHKKFVDDFLKWLETNGMRCDGLFHPAETEDEVSE